MYYRLILLTLTGILIFSCKQESTSSSAQQVQEAPAYQMIDPAGTQIASRFRTPKGFSRTDVDKGGFGEFLRNTYLKPHGEQVYYYNGKVKILQNVFDAVVDWDITSNGMTGSDCIIWFHSEYCYEKGLYEDMVYPLRTGFKMDFTKWLDGYRSIMEENEFRWEKTDDLDSSYFALKNFQEFTFAFADVNSILYQCEKSTPEELDFGTVFISKDRWGHGVIVVDVAEDPETGERLFLLAQSFVPAQQMEILQNPARGELSPWYSVEDIKEVLVTPQWTFNRNECYQLKGL